MNIFENILFNKFNTLVFYIIIALSVNFTFSQDQLNEDIATTDIELDNPPSIVESYVYDPVSDRYFFNQSVGSFNICLLYTSPSPRDS